MSGDAVLEASGLRVGIGPRVLCKRLDLAFRPGQCWGLLGRNGSGKTTLLHTLAGLRPPLGGRIRLRGQGLGSLPRRQIALSLGLLLQERETRFPMSVQQAVLSGRYAHLGPWRQPTEQDLHLVENTLNDVGLTGLRNRNVQTLSGGERQRVAVAALLAQAPRVLLLDEPVSHLDLHEQVRLLRLIRELARAGHVVIMSLHDLNHALAYCDHLLLLHRGRAIGGKTPRIATPRRLSRMYGLALEEIPGPQGTLMVPGRRAPAPKDAPEAHPLNDRP